MTKTRSWSVTAIVVVGVALALYFYWRHSRLYPTTSDAYVGAHVVRVAPQVTGPVVEVAVHDNETVHTGALLLRIDPAPFRIAVAAASAQLDKAKAAVAAARAGVDSAQATVNKAKAQLDDARKSERRTAALVKRGLAPTSKGDSARDALKAARADLDAARSASQQRRRDLTGAVAQKAAAEAALHQARLDLSHTDIDAPADGTIANLDLRPGTVVQANAPLFALVENRVWWVDANYQETALHRLRVGQSARISIDMYPGRTFHGTVESLSPASGVAFSLLPPENATGNWVKVTQRFPVRIRLRDPDPAQPLRVGASAEVTIDTTGQPHQADAQR